MEKKRGQMPPVLSLGYAPIKSQTNCFTLELKHSYNHSSSTKIPKNTTCPKIFLLMCLNPAAIPAHVYYLHFYNNFLDSESVVHKFWSTSLENGLEPSIQLAEYKDGNHDQKILSLNEKALQLLRDIAKPVAVVSICGPYRSGKSYFLSQMLQKKDTFTASSSGDPCTFGIWMSTSVLECKEFVVVFMDTEGTNAAKGKSASKHGDVKKTIVFCTLMSSYLIYNSPGAIRQEELENMRYDY